jgi:hypothetical protein
MAELYLTSELKLFIGTRGARYIDNCFENSENSAIVGQIIRNVSTKGDFYVYYD